MFFSRSPATMRTRRGIYPSSLDSEWITDNSQPTHQGKRHRVAILGGALADSWKAERGPKSRKHLPICSFDSLPDDLLMIVLSAVISTASSAADLVNAMLSCRRFCATAMHPQVLVNAAPAALAVRAGSWSEGAHRFLKQCADAGNIEACYTLGMIRFYCLWNRAGGASLMARAAMQSHAAALHSLAVIQFNGSGGKRKDKDLKAGVALCVMAAMLGHVDAMRELGHCLQDGYGVIRNVYEGRRLLLEANAREAAAAVVASPQSFLQSGLCSISASTPICSPCRDDQISTPVNSYVSKTLQKEAGDHGTTLVSEALDKQHVFKLLQGGRCSLLSDFGCAIQPPKLHIANKFLVDWFGLLTPESGLRLCSHSNCGRPETRRHEFRRCSACGCVNYCSRACQALDWKLRHKYDCHPVADWEDRQDNDFEEDDQIAFEDGDES